MGVCILHVMFTNESAKSAKGEAWFSITYVLTKQGWPNQTSGCNSQVINPTKNKLKSS